jgi:hypothetical protein
VVGGGGGMGWMCWTETQENLFRQTLTSFSSNLPHLRDFLRMQVLTVLASELLGRLVCKCLALPEESNPQVALELLTGPEQLCIRGWCTLQLNVHACAPPGLYRHFLTRCYFPCSNCSYHLRACPCSVCQWTSVL